MENVIAEQNDRILTIKVLGPFNFGIHKYFRDSYTTCVNDNKTDEIIIDFKGTTMIDSAGLGMLLLLKEELSKKNKSIINIINVNEVIASIFKISNFGKLFDIS
jgi:HptB-dependent secretion and biofilm anti anti-sigma factor